MSVQEERSPEALGPYRLRQRLGEGGMGVVYLATDPSQRLVAVKALRRGVPGEATARRRLAREFDMMRRVHSPYVAEVIDADVENDPPYIVTRYVPGRTVEEVISQDGPLTGLALHRLVRGLASALTAVHAAGVVHRDLKPANVMILDGEPVVIDFGIAQAPDSTRLTMTGMFMGTPGYLAPEVIEGSPSGPAADVHSWAATVAFAATGKPPFGTGSFEAIFYRIVNGQPDLATMPTPLMPLVLHALARDPARRPSAAELADRAGSLEPATLQRTDPSTFPPDGGIASATMGDLTARPILAGDPGAGNGFLPAAAAGAGLAGAGLAAGAAAGAAAAGPGLPGAGLANGAGVGLTAAAALPAPVLPAPSPAPRRGGTRQMAVRGRDNYADILPPVRYQPVPAGAGAAQPAGYRQGGRAADRPRSRRRSLVLGVVVTFIAGSVLLPIAGTVAALIGLLALRAADLSGTWLTRRRSRQGVSAGDVAAVVAYLPVATLRSTLRLVLMLPLALLMAAAAAAATYVIVPGSNPLPRAAASAAGALVACYALGPGSARSRRPLSTFFGSITTTAPSAVVVFLCVGALAALVLAAALSVPPTFWPAHHLSLDVNHLPFLHGVLGHGRFSLTKLARRLGIWPFG